MILRNVIPSCRFWIIQCLGGFRPVWRRIYVSVSYIVENGDCDIKCSNFVSWVRTVTLFIFKRNSGHPRSPCWHFARDWITQSIGGSLRQWNAKFQVKISLDRNNLLSITNIFDPNSTKVRLYQLIIYIRLFTFLTRHFQCVTS